MNLSLPPVLEIFENKANAIEQIHLSEIRQRSISFYIIINSMANNKPKLIILKTCFSIFL